MDRDGEPLPTLQKAAYKMTVVRPNEWYDLLNIRYYEHLQKTFYIEWTDTLDKGGNVLLETQVKIFKQNKKNSTNDTKTEEDSNQTLFNPLNVNPEKWSNTLKQIVDNLPTICLSVFDHFMNLALKGLTNH